MYTVGILRYSDTYVTSKLTHCIYIVNTSIRIVCTQNQKIYEFKPYSPKYKV